MVNTQHRIDQQKYIAKAGNRTRIIYMAMLTNIPPTLCYPNNNVEGNTT